MSQYSFISFFFLSQCHSCTAECTNCVPGQYTVDVCAGDDGARGDTQQILGWVCSAISVTVANCPALTKQQIAFIMRYRYFILLLKQKPLF